MCRERGFSFIELLVVLAIIGIIISFALLKFNPSGRSKIKDLSKSVQQVIGEAREKSIIQNRVYRLVLYPNRFDLLKLNSNFRTRNSTENGSIDHEEEAELSGNFSSVAKDKRQKWQSVLSSDNTLSWSADDDISVNLLTDGDNFLAQYEFKLESSFNEQSEDILILWPNGTVQPPGKLVLTADATSIEIEWDVSGKLIAAQSGD